VLDTANNSDNAIPCLSTMYRHRVLLCRGDDECHSDSWCKPNQLSTHWQCINTHNTNSQMTLIKSGQYSQIICLIQDTLLTP